MPRGNDKPEHLILCMDALTSCVHSLNSRLETMADAERDALCSKALALHQESRYTLALTHGIVQAVSTEGEVPFA